MSVWFCSSRPTVASVSGELVVRLMIASRVQVMWSSQSLRMSMRSATAFAVSIGDRWAVMVIAIGVCACCGWLPCAWAMSIPFETASAPSALKKATSAVTAIGSGRETRFVFMSAFLSVVGR